MKNKLFIITNESIYFDKEKNFFCDNIDIKSISEELNKYSEVRLLGRKSKKQRSKKINIENINIFNNIFAYLYFIFKSLKESDVKYLIISLSPYTFLANILLKIFSKKHFIYLRSDGHEEYKAILGIIGKVVYGIMFKISVIKSELIACREHLLRSNKGKIVNPSQLNNKWFNNTKNIDPYNIRLLYVGRLRVEKGIYSLMDMLEGSNFFLTIVTSEVNLKLKEKNKNIKLVNFENYDDAIIKFYDENSILILPSYTEAHPQVLDESLARLRPVIVFKEIEHVKRNREGVFVSERNLKSLEKTINYINHNYENITDKIKTNKLPTKKNFIIQLIKIILN
tara:strand:- start:2657 stop:3673 length:1017 start_codon:yes stop_codon:yes gene_type:complete